MNIILFILSALVIAILSYIVWKADRPTIVYKIIITVFIGLPYQFTFYYFILKELNCI